MAEAISTTSKPRRAKPAPASNVVPLPKAPTEAEAIVADVMGRAERSRRAISQKLHEVSQLLEQRHRERVNELCPIGMAMDRPTLDNFIEIGQRLLAANGGRVRCR